MKHKLSFVVVFILLNVSFIFAQTQVGDNISSLIDSDMGGRSIALSEDGTRVVIGSNNTGTRIFQSIDGNWAQVGPTLEISPTNNQGFSVAISYDGTIVAIGSPACDNNGPNSGCVRIFQESNGNWLQLGDVLNGVASSEFGHAVSLSADGTRIAISSPSILSYTGSVQVYEYSGGVWLQLGTSIMGVDTSDGLGYDVAISGDGTRLVCGGYDYSIPRAYVGVFEESGGNWSLVGDSILFLSPFQDFGNLSVSLSYDGSRLALGYPNYTGSGYYQYFVGLVEIYEEENNAWSSIKYFLGTNQYDVLGSSVSLSGDGTKIAIGMPQLSYNNGQMKVYRETATNWSLVAQYQGFSPVYEGEVGLGFDVAMAPNGTRFAYSVVNAQLDPPPWGNSPVALAYTSVYDFDGVTGQLYFDNNQNCTQEYNEYGAEDRVVEVNPGNYTVHTNTKGNWYIDSLPVGTYTLTIDTSGDWSTTCPLPQTFTVTDPQSVTTAPSIGIFSTNPCTAPDVNISMPLMRPCFTDQGIFVKACNTSLGSETMYNYSLIVTLDSLIIPTDFELPYTDLGNNQFQFDFDSLVVGECQDFVILGTVDCNTEVGQILCVEAELLPLDACVLVPNTSIQSCPATDWDDSSLSVEGYCQNDSIYFVITNEGTGNMTCYSPVSVYVDGMLTQSDSVLLSAQESATFAFLGMGGSWHLQTAQHPYHPANSLPRATVENCGGLTLPSLINLFAMDDAAPNFDVDCDQATGAYDPNDKTGYPLGTTNSHFIKANQQLQYRIRFQNTGNDTAFTVVLRDTLDDDLEIHSIQSGAASHDYEFRIYGQRILEWTFNNIQLPDSTTNEPESHGSVMFTVNQIPNLSEGTEINNSVGIYFDFNEPIITNTTLHTIEFLDDIQALNVIALIPSTSSCDLCDGSATLSLSGGVPPYTYNWSNGETTAVPTALCAGDNQLTLTDANGSSIEYDFTTGTNSSSINTTLTISGNTLIANESNATYQWFDCSNFLFITGETGQTYTPVNPGIYGVAIIQGSCTSVSDCEVMTLIGIEDINQTSFQVYPNPTSGKVFIDFRNTYEEISIQVTNLNGQIIQQETLYNLAQHELEIKGASGLYFLQIQTDTGITKNLKISKF